MPDVVALEIQRRGPTDVTAQAIANTAWLAVAPTLPIPPQIQAWGLGAGESSVLAWGYAHPGTEIILDDLPARRCAAAFNIPVRGTLGLVLIAKQRRIIPAARPESQIEIARGKAVISFGRYQLHSRLKQSSDANPGCF